MDLALNNLQRLIRHKTQPTIINWLPFTFCPVLGHHQGGVYCKSYMTFAFTLLLHTCLAFIFKFGSIKINTKMCRQSLSILFNEIYIN